ncbi:thioesterase family protein [Paraburkholderia susongensis]|uniref:thioesterase family protein n=1 Tax=Paraburkholderia susongensis TaxID=1515439 RepID=UPI000A1CF15A
MTKETTYRIEVQFGDCDPAGIVFFPNFSRWMDAASHDYFLQCGLPPRRKMESLPGCIGVPLLEIHSRFHTSATYGEMLHIRTSTEEWRGKVFVQRHRALRGYFVFITPRTPISTARRLSHASPASGR